MMKIYLDWNVMAQIKTCAAEPGIALAQKIEEHREKLLIPYSPGHIADLKKGWDKSPENNALIEQDLEFISKLTQNNLFILYWKKELVNHDNRVPASLFHED